MTLRDKTAIMRALGQLQIPGVKGYRELHLHRARNLASIEIKPHQQGEAHDDSVGNGRNVSQLMHCGWDGVQCRSFGLAAGNRSELRAEVALCRARRSDSGPYLLASTRRALVQTAFGACVEPGQAPR